MDETTLFKSLMGTNALDSRIRSTVPFSDELVFRKARIYEILGPQNDLLRVQPLPELQGIPDNEMEDLPVYSPFRKGEVIMGLDYKTHGDKAEFVWILCTPDLQVGYIFAKVNKASEYGKKYGDSYNYKKARSYLSARGAIPSDFDYKHIQVVDWVSTPDGGMIQCYNYRTGEWVLINSSGTCLVVLQQQMYMRVGTPPPEGTNTKSAFSAINITPDKIFMKSTLITMDADKILLGDGAAAFNCAGIMSSGPSNDNGVPVNPSSKVFVSG